MQEELQKLELLLTGEGYRVYQTSEDDCVVWEWDAEPVCRLAQSIHTTLRRHALGTCYEGPFGPSGILARGLTPLPFWAEVKVQPTAVAVTYCLSDGTPLEQEAAQGLPGVGPGKMTAVEDSTLHTGRILRAYLWPAGLSDMTLALEFGVAATGECQMQVINPLKCSFGSMDYEDLCRYLGGDKS